MGAGLPDISGVHAVTDVTGFGLLGHALEMARGAKLSVAIEAAAPPLHPGVEALARDGVRTGAAGRNWASYGEAVVLPDGFEDWRRDLLCDPQTSGGLLIAVAPEAADTVLDLARASGFDRAAVVGGFTRGPAVVGVEA
jgi:selenide, water dikinase